MQIYLRQGNITFSKEFVNTIREEGIILTRRDKFNRSGIIINHGNSKNITIGKNAKDVFIINQPDAIRYCSNKTDNCKILRDYYPIVYKHIEDVDKFPVIVKPLHGHHGYGIVVCNDMRELSSFMHSTNELYIIQQYIPIKHEFRFNVFDKNVFQISHKQQLDERTEQDGYVFTYRSLGENAKLSQKFRDFVSNVITTFHSSIGYSLGDYCVDVIKGQDGKYYLSELNSAYGIGQFTIQKLIDVINTKYDNGDLESYRVR